MKHALDRRSLLAAAGASAAAIALGAPALARAPSAARTLKKAVGIGMVGEGDTLLDKFLIVRDCGFQGLELDSPSELKHEDVLAAQEKSGVRVHGLVDSKHWSHPLNSFDKEVRAESIAALETALRDAKLYGSTSVLLVPAVVNAKLPYAEAWKRSQDAIRRVLPLARELGVRIAVENVWNQFLESPLEAARYVDEFQDPSLAFHFDIGNVVNYGWPEQWIAILGPRIVKLHVKDYSRKKRDDEGLWKGFDVELGQGDANYAAVMPALDAVGYSTAPQGNWATAEVNGGDRKRLKQISDQMDHLFSL